jgi:hypothetical protein
MSAVASSRSHFIEKTCNAGHIPEKLRIFSDARYLMDDAGRFMGLLLQIFTLYDEDSVDIWLAESLHDSSEMLVKYLLFQGFYASSKTDLWEYVDDALSALEAETLPGRHNLSAAPARLQ